MQADRPLASRTTPCMLGIMLATLLLGPLGAEERVRRVCIPNADRSDWICGTEDAPPEPPAEGAAGRDAPPPPPPFLADPQRTRSLPLIPIARPPARAASGRSAASTPAAPAADSAPSAPRHDGAGEPERPVAARTPADRPTAAPERAPVDSAVREAEADALPPGDPRSPAAPADPGSVAAAANTAVPTADAGAASRESVPSTPAATADRPSTPPTGETAATSLPAPWRSDVMLSALADQWTLQLAHGPDAAALGHLAGELGLPTNELFLLPLERDGAAWWLLARGLYASPDQARRAGAALGDHPGLRGAWPRRVEPLQNEIRRAHRTVSP